MKNTIIMASAGLVSLGLATSAMAVEPCKWYAKVGGGYTFTTKPEYNYKSGATASTTVADAVTAATTDITVDADKAYKGANVEVGVGYNMTESFRGDVAFTYYMLKNKPGKNSDGGYVDPWYLDTKSMRFVANAYYDMNTNTNFIPFVTAGLGLDVSKSDIKFNNFGSFTSGTPAAADTRTFFTDQTTIAAVDKVKGKNKTSFAYQMGVGVAYKFSEGMYLDLAYRFENLEKAKDFKDTAFGAQVVQKSSSTPSYLWYTGLETKRIWKNSINAGLRFEF